MRCTLARVAASMVLLAAYGATGAKAEDPAFGQNGILLTMPTSPNVIMVCNGFNCRYRDLVYLTSRDVAEMTRLMRPGKASAAAERAALGRLMAWFDRRIGPQVGSVNHVAQAGVAHAGQRGQFDCVDTTHNATLVLRELHRLKLLVHHRPVEPASRFGPPFHNTAVMVDGGTGESWAVDGWISSYGEEPDIIPLSAWRRASIRD